MKYMDIKGSDMKVSRLALGCMRIGGKTVDEVEELIQTALDCGINFFDHADIYGAGASERVFGAALAKHPEWRSKMYIQSKCGIKPGVCYDFSKDYIKQQVDTSLENLQTDYLDVLLLHRPDVLMDAKEVADAFNELYESGKVHYFGVSNMNPGQIKLIKKYCKQPILFDQVQFNLVNSTMIDAGLHVNMNDAEAVVRDGGLLEYCELEDITIQPWSILQASWVKGSFLGHPDYESLNAKLEEMGEKYGLDKAAMSVAWILRLACMQPIAGTTSPEHLRNLCKAADVEMSREDFYALYLSNGKILP